jgi:hypothetical protein
MGLSLEVLAVRRVGGGEGGGATCLEEEKSNHNFEPSKKPALK